MEHRITTMLAAYRTILWSLSSKEEAWAAKQAMALIGKYPGSQSTTRSDLFAAMEACLGIEDLELLALQEEAEEWLAVEAPHEFEHYQAFRLRKQFHDIQHYPSFRSSLDKDGWVILQDDGMHMLAVSIQQRAILATVTMKESRRGPHLLALVEHAYSDQGFDSALIKAVRAHPEASAIIPHLKRDEFRHFSRIKDLVRQHEHKEEQLDLGFVVAERRGRSGLLLQ